MSVSIFPYGNAQEEGGKIVCQHGSDECKGNLVETCLIHYVPKFSDYFPVIHCMEGQGEPSSDLDQCSDSLSSDVVSNIKACAAGKLGKQLEQKMKEATDALQPSHTFVPWVTINGNPLGENVDILVSSVCETYTGPKPSACA
mmetsp:Transcript_10380/g.27200  ORF Transcript_10380/g.27200 Transcript_10380/m.27200 type:complete len:143 (-) Transcript_10380:139-567(-)